MIPLMIIVSCMYNGRILYNRLWSKDTTFIRTFGRVLSAVLLTRMKYVEKGLLSRYPAAVKPPKMYWLFKVLVKRQVKQSTRHRTVTHAKQSFGLNKSISVSRQTRYTVSKYLGIIHHLDSWMHVAITLSTCSIA